MPSEHICARWDMMLRSTFSSNSIKRSVIQAFIGPSSGTKTIFPLSGERYIPAVILTHQNVARVFAYLHPAIGRDLSQDIACVSTNPVIRTDEFDRWVTTLCYSPYPTVSSIEVDPLQTSRLHIAYRTLRSSIIFLWYSGREMLTESRRRAGRWRHEREGNAIFHF